MTVLLDTTIASLLHPRRRGSSRLVRCEPHLKGHVLAISFQTYAEFWHWAETSRWGDRERQRLGVFLRAFLLLPFTEPLGQTWARVMAQSKAAGRRIEAGDGWIAASAVLYGIPLVTSDADFEGLVIEGLSVIFES